ncbi:MAG: hypothetical protein WD079_02985, partial [Phycisphaeraceae bacterium]
GHLPTRPRLTDSRYTPICGRNVVPTRISTKPNSQVPPRPNVVGWLLTATAAVGLLGVAIESMLGYGPWMALFWHEQWMSPLVTPLTGMSWNEYVSSASTTAALGWVGFGIGVFYGLAGLMCIVGRPRWLVASALMLAAGLLGLDAWLSYHSHGGRVFQGLEHALQVFAPLAVVSWLLFAWRGNEVRWALRLAVSLTFFSHGLWALGASLAWGPVHLDYPTPGEWVDMVMKVFPLMDEQTARSFLQVAGVLDLAVAAAMLLPDKVARPVLVWAIIWGALTAAARIVAHFDDVSWADSMGYWWSQALRRAPHAGLPLALWLMLRQRASAPSADATADELSWKPVVEQVEQANTPASRT